MSTEDRIFESLKSDFFMEISGVAADLRKVCESEIEIMFGATAIIALRLLAPDFPFRCIKAENESANDGVKYILMPQYPWDRFRIDWVLRILAGGQKNYFFVECDGHDFHERTKEQAERDRSKDRAIQAAGIPILRFTGREIYRDASACVTELMNFSLRALPPIGEQK